MLGLRDHVLLDTGASLAECVYGVPLRIPGEFVFSKDFSPDPQVFINEYREHTRAVKPVPVEPT